MNRRWICSDVWMDILPSFDHAQLGLKMALLSDRFDVLVDAHFDGKSELTIWRRIRIEKDEGPNANDNGPKPKMSILIDDNSVDFPFSDRQLPNKICFKNLQIDYIDRSVIEFLHSKKRFFDRSGTGLEVFVYPTDAQQIWDVFIREIWPIFATNIRHLGFLDANYMNNLRRRTSPTILTDLDQLNSIDSGRLLPEVIADYGPNATAGQVLSKWLHTPSKDGQPKRLYRKNFLGPLNFGWVNSFKETFRRATTSVSYHIQLYFCATTMPTEQFELVNERTKEKLTLKQKTEVLRTSVMKQNIEGFDKKLFNWLLKRCPIGETATVPAIKWEDSENPSANLNNINFDLLSFNKSIGPLSPPAEEKEEEADQSNKNVV